MGKSIANTLRTNNFSGKIIVSSRSQIENCNFVDKTFDLQKTNQDDFNNSIIFICTPPNIVAETLQQVFNKTQNNENCIISDICSIKKDIAKITNKNFVSIHQMDGGNSDEKNKYFFKKPILNYIITNNVSNVNINLLEQYKTFLHDFLNCKNVEITAKIHDKTVALTSHLQNLILASYCNNFSKIDNLMWREIFSKNKENISYFLHNFLKTMEQNIINNSFEDAIILTVKKIMKEEKIEIKKELFNPSLKAVFELKNNSINGIENKINYQSFVKNMQGFFEKLVSEER